MRYVIAYDISCDRRRERVAKALESSGRRVQYSVFECELDRRELVRVLTTLEHLIEPGTDRVRLYRLCGACAGEIASLGVPAAACDDEMWIV